jgi:hypothetical protein
LILPRVEQMGSSARCSIRIDHGTNIRSIDRGERGRRQKTVKRGWAFLRFSPAFPLTACLIF